MAEEDDDDDEGRRPRDPSEGVRRQTRLRRQQIDLVFSADLVVAMVKCTTSPRSRQPGLGRNRDGAWDWVVTMTRLLRSSPSGGCVFYRRVLVKVQCRCHHRDLRQRFLRSRSRRWDRRAVVVSHEPRTSPLSCIFSVWGDGENSGTTSGFWADLAGFGLFFFLFFFGGGVWFGKCRYWVLF